MSTTSPLVSATGIWYAYFPVQTQTGDGASHILDVTGAESFGNVSLFSDVVGGMSLAHRAVVNVDVHAECEHEIAIERTLGVHIDKAGAILERGQSIFVTGEGNSAYQGILDEGHMVKSFVSAPGDQVSITGGYISVMATPI